MECNRNPRRSGSLVSMPPETKTDGFIEANESLKQTELITHVSPILCAHMGTSVTLHLRDVRASSERLVSKITFPDHSLAHARFEYGRTAAPRGLLWTCNAKFNAYDTFSSCTRP